MERHIDLDAAMIKHLERSGYVVTKEGDVPKPPDDNVSDLFRKCMTRAAEANKKYNDAWDYLTNIGLAEIIVMKAVRLRSAVNNEDDDTAVDSLVDLCNYSAKLYLEIIIGPED